MRAVRVAGPDQSRRAFLVAAPVTVLGLALVGCGGDDTPKPSSSTSNGAGSSPESAGSQWPMYGHDFAQTRTNVTETGITRDNVDRLAKAWEIPDVIGPAPTIRP